MKRIFLLLVCTVFLSACSGQTEKQKEIEMLDKDITDLEREINELKADNDDLKQKLKSKGEELNQIEKQYEE